MFERMFQAWGPAREKAWRWVRGKWKWGDSVLSMGEGGWRGWGGRGKMDASCGEPWTPSRSLVRGQDEESFGGL